MSHPRLRVGLVWRTPRRNAPSAISGLATLISVVTYSSTTGCDTELDPGQRASTGTVFGKMDVCHGPPVGYNPAPLRQVSAWVPGRAELCGSMGGGH